MNQHYLPQLDRYLKQKDLKKIMSHNSMASIQPMRRSGASIGFEN